MPYVGQKPADIISTAVDTVTGAFSGAVTVDGAAILNGGIDVAGDITLDVDGEDIKLLDAGTQWGQFSNSSTNFVMFSPVQDKDIIFKGKDGSDTITALTLDMSDAGSATFSHNVKLPDNGVLALGAGSDLSLSSNGTNGTIAAPNGTLTIDVAGDITLDADGGDIILKDGGTTIGSIGTSGGATFYGGPSSGIMFNGVNINPTNGTATRVDNTNDIGVSNFRFDDIFATNGTIQTSDRNEKQDIEELTDAETRVAVVAKGLMRKFRWKDKVAEKGDDARTHFGIIAQDLQDAFTAESLDASKYAMFCSDTWWEKEISVDAVEADEANGIEAKDAYTYMDDKQEATTGYTEKTRLGVRYSELLAFIISAI